MNGPIYILMEKIECNWNTKFHKWRGLMDGYLVLSI